MEDLCCYFLEKARVMVDSGIARRVGLLATNSVRGGFNRGVLNRIKKTGDIFLAWSDEEWILDGAAVRISIVGFDSGIEKNRSFNGAKVDSINSDLTVTADVNIAV